LYASEITLILHVKNVLKPTNMARRKKSDEDPDQQDNNAENTDDTFGLPEIEYEPLKRGETAETEPPVEQTTYREEPQRPTYEREEVHNEYTTTYEDDDEESSAWPKIVGVLALLLLAGAAYWFFAKYQPAQREKLRIEQEQAANAEKERLANEQRLADQKAREEADQRRADSLANVTTKEGTVETLSERTQRYYVVVASAIDGDLIMDEAKKLSAKGVSAKIIPPFGKTKFYRLAIADGDTYADTQTRADGMKGEYGEKVWVVRY
jgi:hypothetical protein